MGTVQYSKSRTIGCVRVPKRYADDVTFRITMSLHGVRDLERSGPLLIGIKSGAVRA